MNYISLTLKIIAIAAVACILPFENAQAAGALPGASSRSFPSGAQITGTHQVGLRYSDKAKTISKLGGITSGVTGPGSVIGPGSMSDDPFFPGAGSKGGPSSGGDPSGASCAGTIGGGEGSGGSCVPIPTACTLVACDEGTYPRIVLVPGPCPCVPIPASTCGDGAIQFEFGEFCDDGNVIDGDGCTSLCKREVCGDGLVNNSGAEACDDGNVIDGDGCSATCTIDSTDTTTETTPDDTTTPEDTTTDSTTDTTTDTTDTTTDTTVTTETDEPSCGCPQVEVTSGSYFDESVTHTFVVTGPYGEDGSLYLGATRLASLGTAAPMSVTVRTPPGQAQTFTFRFNLCEQNDFVCGDYRYTAPTGPAERTDPGDVTDPAGDGDEEEDGGDTPGTPGVPGTPGTDDENDATEDAAGGVTGAPPPESRFLDYRTPDQVVGDGGTASDGRLDPRQDPRFPRTLTDGSWDFTYAQGGGGGPSIGGCSLIPE